MHLPTFVLGYQVPALAWPGMAHGMAGK